MAIPTAVVPVSEIFDLRWEVLRAGLPRESAVFTEDSDLDTFHVAAYDERGTVAACVTFFPDPFPGPFAVPFPGPPPGAGVVPGPGPGHRFRGLASAPEARGLGFGHTVLEAGLEELAKRGVGLVWCNGRVSAAAFYAREGFTVVGDEFVLESGPHLRFVKVLASE
ncbi:GNAT family N-acetyltransferase [Streptomyces sp. H27-D2]|uniref:GNAT family N-acetyltransferase n=1 Tax=Streptomyces sp. H27-D2 TaxID=3046304 RepID=UPI002DBE3E7B|nr:GNAT family N-acetyltransferase [Streptomyces sp. H27-D2]MEC4017679.1 GNAT family N-acetyltransferase [Streptomyces sp. H27-D2]